MTDQNRTGRRKRLLPIPPVRLRRLPREVVRQTPQDEFPRHSHVSASVTDAGMDGKRCRDDSERGFYLAEFVPRVEGAFATDGQFEYSGRKFGSCWVMDNMLLLTNIDARPVKSSSSRLTNAQRLRDVLVKRRACEFHSSLSYLVICTAIQRRSHHAACRCLNPSSTTIVKAYNSTFVHPVTMSLTMLASQSARSLSCAYNSTAIPTIPTTAPAIDPGKPNFSPWPV
jgi:hypothetical protein